MKRTDELPEILVFASGSKDGGGSGFAELIANARSGVLKAGIGAVISNHEKGGVRRIADTNGVSFRHFAGPYDAENYKLLRDSIFDNYPNWWVMLSGWLKEVHGLDPSRTVNIHPGPLPDPGKELKFGGKGMYGHHVHEACIAAHKAGQLKFTAVCMHFVNDDYDQGPVFFRYPVLIREDDTAETLGARVNKIEHGWQSWVTSLVVHHYIELVGGKVIVPDWYKQEAFCPEYLR